MGLYFALREKIRLNRVGQRLIYSTQSLLYANFGRLCGARPTLIGNSPTAALALCLRFRNEALYLQEWIDYYIAAGASHFFLYNNFSSDDYLPVLEPYMKLGLVDLIDWPFKPASPSAEEDCIRRAIGRYKWVGFLDADEFVVVKDNQSIPEFLADFGSQAAVALNWWAFGSNGHKTRPMEPVTTAYSRRAHSPNSHVKCIVRPERVAQCRNSHSWYFRGMSCPVNERGKGVYGSLSIPASARRAWINHYYYKSEEDYRSRMGMQSALDRIGIKYPSRREDRLAQAMRQANDVEDDCAARYFRERCQASGLSLPLDGLRALTL